jgi:hypothetical protein
MAWLCVREMSAEDSRSHPFNLKDTTTSYVKMLT